MSVFECVMLGFVTILMIIGVSFLIYALGHCVYSYIFGDGEESEEDDLKNFDLTLMGSVWNVSVGSRKEIGLAEGYQGLCCTYAKTILISDDKDDCATDAEVAVRVEETLAHELIHAYISESGITLDEEVEEVLANFYMKNWIKLKESMEECSKYLDI